MSQLAQLLDAVVSLPDFKQLLGRTSQFSEETEGYFQGRKKNCLHFQLFIISFLLIDIIKDKQGVGIQNRFIDILKVK